MAAEALIVEDAYQRGYADAIADRLKLLQRWVNNRIIFRSCKRFEEYDGRK